MGKINVLVTGIGGGSHGEQIIKALRLAKNLDLNIIGTDITEYTSGKELVDVFILSPRVTDPEYLNHLETLIDKFDIKFLFHGSETALKFMSEHRDFLKQKNVMHPLNSKELIELCMNKYQTYLRLKELGVRLPKFWKIDRIEDTDRIDSFPLVLKPSTSSGGSSHVYIVVDREELRLFSGYMLKQGVDIVAQEYVGSDNEEYTIGVSSDFEGKLLGSIVVRRIINNALSTRLKVNYKGQQLIISSGVSQGEVCHMPDLQRQAEDIAVKLGSKGPVNIQCRYVDGELMLMEINPRLSGTTSIRAIAGYNEPALMINYYLSGASWDVSYNDLTIMRTITEVIV